MGKTLILIDGHALAFRQYYALERTNMQTSDGTPTWAVFGFFKAIFDLLKNKNLKADAIAVAFDVSHKTFRTEKYGEYKSNRAAMPDPMRLQMGLINEGLRAFNIPVYTKEGYEADDVIGTISKKACELGHNVLILTGDQDAFQLVDKQGCVKVILPFKGELIEYNWDKIYEKLGVYPDQVIDYKGLRGDVSDCIPGIKGIGEKTAQKLLARYGTLDAVLKDCENIQEKSIREKICNGIEQARLSKYLATIVRDLDVEFDFDKTKVELPQLSTVIEFLKKMQFYTFIKNINSILNSFNKSENTLQASYNNFGAVQLGFFSEVVNQEINKESFQFEQKLITDSEDLNKLAKFLSSRNVFAFKTYAEIKNAVSADIIGISFAISDGVNAGDKILLSDNTSLTDSFYIPLKHSNLFNQLKSEDVLAVLKPVFENPDIRKIVYNAKTEYNVLLCNGINVQGMLFDVQLASYVKDSQRNHELDVQAMEHLYHSVCQFAPFENDKRKKTAFKDADINSASGCACDEAAVIIELCKYWTKELSEAEEKLVYNIEIPLSKVLSDMEIDGVAIDIRYLANLTSSMNACLGKIEEKIYKIAGGIFNINSPRQVGEVLFVKLGLKSKKKKGKANFSTSAAVLEELAQEHEIVRLILEYRKYAKLKSTYTEALPALIEPKDNRIHTSYNQTNTVTGRLSSSNPNLQNIPIRTEEGNKIRNAFVAEDKETSLILSADYSQIELRILAHITEDKHLVDAFTSKIDVHTLTASKVFDIPVSEVTKDMRYKAKAVNFGIIYGQSKYGLAKALGISNADAEDFINKYFATYQRVKAYMEGTILEVQEKGFVETIFGRKRYLTAELASSNAMIREFGKRAAINFPMQGSAADLMKMAMIDFSGMLKENNLKSKMIIQVHDELVVEVLKSELDIVTKLIKDSMELNQPLRVPLVVDINVGDTWKE